MISDSFKRELLSRINIVDVVSSRMEIQKRGKDFYGQCPFHDDGKNPSFTVSEGKQFFYCHGCGASGDAVTFLMDYSARGFREAIRELAGLIGAELPDIGPTDPKQVKRDQESRTAREVLGFLEKELIIAVLCVSDARKGRQVSDEDHQRFLTAINRLMTAIEVSRSKPLMDEERRHILGEEQQQKEAA